MRCVSRPAGRVPWAVLYVILAVLIATDPAAHPPARFSCDASTPPASPSGPRVELRSSSATVEGGGSNGAEGRTADDSPQTPPSSNAAESDALRFSDAFFQCYADVKQRDSGSTLSCVGEGARVGLESFFTRRDVHVADGLTLVDEQHHVPEPVGREVPFPEDILPPPSWTLFDGQHRSVIDSAAAYLSARALRWDMGGLYPGLVMRVGPTLSAGNGWLEFVLEPRRFYSDRQLGPGRSVVKQVVLPFLLGLKVSVASLVPLLLFAIVFLAKKALLMSQLSALVSGLLGFGAFAAPYGQYGHPHSFGDHGLPPPGGPGGPGGPLGPLGPLGNPLIPLRTSPQVFPNPQRHPPPVEEGPQILHLGSNPLPGTLPASSNLAGTLASGAFGANGLLSPSWLSGGPGLQGALGAHPHLFRKVNYDFRDERHAQASSSATSVSSSATSNTKGFRWEDEKRAEDGDPRTQPEDSGRNSRSGNALWTSRSMG